MKNIGKKLFVGCLLGLIASVVFSGCAAMTTLPQNKLQETASAVIGKPVVSVSNIRSVDDMEYFDAQTNDGIIYACSLQVLFGTTSQHQKCEKK